MVIDRRSRVQRVHARVSKAVWLARYWVMDKYRDRLALAICACAGVVAALCGTMVGYLLLRPAPTAGAIHADGGISIFAYLLVMLVSAIVMYAMAPKPEPAKPVDGKTPVVEDGKAIRRIYGTVWIDDSAILAWTNLDPEPIRKKGGKK